MFRWEEAGQWWETWQRNGRLYFRKDIAGRLFGDRNGIANVGSHEVTSAVADTACGVGSWVRDTAVADTRAHDARKHLQTEVV